MTTFDYNAVRPTYNILTGQKINYPTSAQQATSQAQTTPVPTASNIMTTAQNNATGTGALSYQPPTSQPTISAPVITSKAAQDDAAKKLQAWQTLQVQVQNQKSVLAQQAAQKLANDAKAQYDATQVQLQNKQLDQKQQEIDNKASVAGLLTNQNQPAAQSKVPPGWDPQDYANFKAANPTLEPDDTDTRLMQTAGTPAGIGEYAQVGISNAQNQYGTDIGSIVSQQNTLTQQSIQSLSSLLSGTIPLSSTQHTLISALQSQLQQNIAIQTQANDSNVGTLQESLFRSGGEYTPTQTSGMIHNAISLGVQKIQTLDNSAAITMAQLEQGFQKDNYDIINKQYGILNDQLQQKSEVLKNIYDNTVSAIKDYRDNQQKSVQEGITNQLNSDRFNYQKTQDSIQNAFTQGQITESQRHNMVEEANQSAQLVISKHTQALQEQQFNSAYGLFTDANGTPSNVKPDSIPGYTKLPNGVSVINDANGLYKTNKIGGLNVVNPTDFKAVSQAAANTNTINTMQLLYNQVLSGSSQGSAAETRSQYNTLLAGLPTDVQKQIPSLGRFDGGILTNRDVANSQFNTAYQSINSNVASIIPNSSLPKYGKVFSSPQEVQSYFTSTGQQKGYDASVVMANQLAQKYYGRNANDGEILQVINGQ